MTQTCSWSPYDDFDMPGTFDTSCGNIFSFTEEGIKENNFKFCPYCGGEIIEVSPPKKPD